MTEIKNKRGGAREGAGRKRGERTVPIGLRISEEASKKLTRVTKNKSKFVNDLIMAYEEDIQDGGTCS